MCLSISGGQATLIVLSCVDLLVPVRDKACHEWIENT